MLGRDDSLAPASNTPKAKENLNLLSNQSEALLKPFSFCYVSIYRSLRVKNMEELTQFESGFAPDSAIEDPRGHSSEVVERLRQALASGAPAVPEARRPGFFEVRADEHVFYIHISPVTQRITLLATWSVEPVFATVPSA
jgi:hypothetical protein